MSALVFLPEAAEGPMGTTGMLTLPLDRGLFPAFAVLGRCGAIKAYPRNVVTGQIKVFVSEAQGKEVTLTLEGPGGYFGVS